jgi:shikimate dehydrogenase
MSSTPRGSGSARRAAVLGKPIAHSLSPVIHNAGYAAAGLTGWSYTAHECAEQELAGFVATLGPEWAGLSLTMPLKEVALTVADQASQIATTLGAANTLHRRDTGWYAENTDASGMVDALRDAGVTAAERIAVLGAGGTARAALAAAAELGAEVTVHARRPEAIEDLRGVADALGVPLAAAELTHSPGGTAADAELAGGAAADADLLISTLPAGAADPIVAWLGLRPGLVVFEVLYHPWPTPLVAAAEAAGCTVVGGLDLLLAQAVRQFELFTGVPAPVPAMRDALHAAAR